MKRLTDTAITSDVTVFKLGKVGMMNTRQGLNVLSAGLTGERILFNRVSIGDGIMEVESDLDFNGFESWLYHLSTS